MAICISVPMNRTHVIGARKVRIADHSGQPMFGVNLVYLTPTSCGPRRRFKSGHAMFREVLSLEIKEDCVLECAVPGVGEYL